MRRRRNRGGHRDPPASEPRPDPLQAAVDRYSYRPESPNPDERSPDSGQAPYRGQHWYPTPASYPQPPDDQQQAYRGRHSQPVQEPAAPRDPQPDERAYPEPDWYPGSQSAGHSAAGQQPSPRRQKKRRRKFVVIAAVAVLLAATAAAGAGYLLLHTRGSPRQTASAYLRAWQHGDYREMAKVSVGVPQGGLSGPLKRTDAQLGVRRTTLRLGAVTGSPGGAVARFTVADRLTSNHTWTYQGRLRLVVRNRRWWVNWSPAAIYPGLRLGQRFTLTSAWPSRAQIYAADGTVLSSPAAWAQSGSIALLTGIIVKATAAQAKKLGAPYKAGDLTGEGGIEQAYQGRLAGAPSLTIKLAGPGKQARTVRTFKAVHGRPVKTSIMMSYQLAAAGAVLSSTTTKPVDMVVIQPSTGRVLAMVERPGSWDKAIDGTYPPGSTFKIITASALAKQGMTPSSTVQCPSTVTIGGYTIHNDKNEQLGTTTLLKAFAISCNTTFAGLAASRLTGAKLAAMARMYGFNAKPALGIPAQLGSFVVPHTPVDLAADAFGQGKDLVSPLSQAAEVAAVQSGVWRPPLLVIDPRPRQTARPHPISPTILATLRPMMHAVVTIGTAAGVGFPPDVYGKTGTAEYGSGSPPKAHGWFIGYRGDLAFAVLVEGGGYGASSAAPIANAFLRRAP